MPDNPTSTCQHTPGIPACPLPTCGGTPPADEPMDRDLIAVSLPSQVLSGGRPHPFVPKRTGDGSGPEYCVDPCHRHRTDEAHGPAAGQYDTGQVDDAREIILAVAAVTGFRVDDGVIANNGWADIRPDRRKVDGLTFTVDNIPVRVLSYEAKLPLATYRTWQAAVYVGDVLVQGAVNQERPAAEWHHMVVQAIAREAERQHDARLLALPDEHSDLCLLLKDPPVGFVVDVPDRGDMTVHEASTNEGMTLRVLDGDDNHRFIDRRSAGVWITHRPRPPAPEPTGPVHVLSSSPTVVVLGEGYEGLANPTWCGRTWLPDGERAWHTYGLKAERVTCPVCFHLYTCPWAAVKDGDEFCPVCVHIFGCEDQACKAAGCAEFVPAPGPVDVKANADAVIARIVQALADGEFGLAERLLDAGDDHRLGAVGDSETWDDLRARARAAERARMHTASADETVDEAGVLWGSVITGLRG
jgi:hypothetical protein